MALANFVITTLGFGPYFYFGLWAIKYPQAQMTMVASVIPPLAAKMSASFIPLVYVVTCRKFRQAYAAVLFGSEPPRANKAE